MLEASVAKLTRDELGAAVLDMISALEEAVCPEESAGFLDTHGIFLLLDCSEVDERTRQVVCSLSAMFLFQQHTHRPGPGQCPSSTGCHLPARAYSGIARGKA